MQRDDTVYLGHMLDMARKAVDKVAGKTRGDYDSNEDLRFVLAHCVQVIGEAASRVSTEFRASHQEIPWKRIVAMRHRIVHDYMNVDEDILWEVVSAGLPDLIRMLTPLMPTDES